MDRRTSTVATALACVLLTAGCGGDPVDEPDPFTACGGDIVAGWDFSAVTFPAGGDQCPALAAGDAGVDGFIVFNANGRYSLSLKVKAYQQASTGACDFAAAYGGFYRVVGSRVCLEGSAVEGTAIACDSDTAAASRGVGKFCVAGDALTIESSSLFDLGVVGRLALIRKP